MDGSHHKKSYPKTKKSLRRVDVEIVRRIITLLHEHGNERKTKVALKTHLAYDKCIRYLEWLEMMGFIHRNGDVGGSEFINLTKSGNDLYFQYSNVDDTILNLEKSVPDMGNISNIGNNIPNIEDF